MNPAGKQFALICQNSRHRLGILYFAAVNLLYRFIKWHGHDLDLFSLIQLLNTRCQIRCKVNIDKFIAKRNGRF